MNLVLRKNCITFLLVLAGNFFYSQNSVNKDSLNQQIKIALLNADTAYQKGAYDEAINLYSQIIKLSPKDSLYSLHYLRARAYLGMFNYKRANKDVEKALAIPLGIPKFNFVKANAYWIRAKVCTAQNKISEAVNALEEACRYQETSSIFSTLGFLQIELKQYDRAATNFNRSISLNNQHAYSYSNRALLKLKLNDTSGAKDDIIKAIELDPKNPYAYKHSALYYLATKNYDSVCSNLKRAHDLDYYYEADEFDKNDVSELIDKYCTLDGKPARKFTFAVRGKFITFVVIEDAYFRTATLGGELFYKDRHSIGIDANYFRWRNEHDNSDDVPMYEEYSRRLYLLADYKLRMFNFKGFRFYFNLYIKGGNYREWYDRLNYAYTVDTAFLRSTVKGIFTETGTGFGVKKYVSGSRFGYDISANYAWRRSKNNSIAFVSTDQSIIGNGIKGARPVFYMRLNFFYHFGK